MGRARGVRRRKSERLSETLLAEIATRYKPGQLFHTQRELMARFDAGYTTIARVIRELEARGVLEARPRKGLFVKAVPAGSELAPVTVCLFVQLPQGELHAIQSAYHRGLALAAEEHAFALKLLPLERDPERMLSAFREAGGQGILFFQDEQASFIRRVQAEGIPHMVLHPYRARFENSIEIDDGWGVQQAILALARKGARRILFVCEKVRSAHDQAKLDGYHAGLDAAGLPRDEALVEQVDIRAVVGLLKRTHEIVRRRADYDAAIAMDPRILEFLDGVFEIEGVRVPDDVRLVVYGSWGYTAHVRKPLGVVRVPYERAAQEGIAQLLRACRDPDYQPGTHLLRPSFEWRE
ncbi:MAG: GntR family transcriptional regulator [Kiritimatiellae bacterium]|nr:GntR family transcriptional regulator [Kiritimatiellia bacterium]